MDKDNVRPLNMRNFVFLRLVDMAVALEQILDSDFSGDVLESLTDLRLSLARCIYRVFSSDK